VNPWDYTFGLTYYWPRQWYLYNVAVIEPYTWPASYYIGACPVVAASQPARPQGIVELFDTLKDTDKPDGSGPSVRRTVNDK